MSRAFCYFWTKIHPSWLLYASFSGVILGTVLTVVIGRVFFASWLWLVVGILSIYYCLRWPHRAFIVIAFLSGVIIGNFRLKPEITGQNILRPLVGEEIIIAGTISDDPNTASGQTAVSLSNLELTTSDHKKSVSGTLYVKLSTSVQLERSDQITMQGVLLDGFGTYAGAMYRPELLEVRRTETGDIFARIKLGFAENIKQYIPSPEVDLGVSYLMGLKSGLSDDLSDTLRAVGMTHVIVASGAHLGILVSAARKIFGKLSKFSGLLGSLLLIASFVLIVGFTPSMTRAALVSSLSLSVGYFGRKFTPLRLLIFVAMLTLLISPLNCLNLGWQLSFASFFALLIIAPRLQRLFYGGKKVPWLADMLLTSLATTITCAPILIYNFGTLSLLSFVANLFILPTLPYAMLLVFLTGATSFWPWLAGIIGRLASLLLNIHIWLVNFLAEKTMFIFELPAGNPLIFLIYFPLLVCLGWPSVFLKIVRSATNEKKADSARNDRPTTSEGHLSEST